MKKFLINLPLLLAITLLMFITFPTLADTASNPPPGGGGSATSKEPCPNNKCDTAIGIVDVSSPVVVVTKIFSIALSLGGFAALIIIIFSGYKLLVSRANKEIVQGARETLTSAIVGLLFIVFSLVILSVIAGDIIKIPGFN